jgi:exosortase/archaeosortase family protein
MDDRSPSGAVAARRALVQALVLVGLVCLAYRAELFSMFDYALDDGEGAHALAMPVLAFLLLWRRRRDLAAQVSAGSAWGVALLGLSLAATFVAAWPFNHGIPRRLAMVPALAGAILAVCGRRVLRQCAGPLLLFLLAIPVGARIQGMLMRQPERISLRAGLLGLESLPGVDMVHMEGPQMRYVAGDRRGVIAMGEPHRWAMLIPASLSIVVFVAFARQRPLWHLAVLALAALPVALGANIGRLIALGGVTVYGGAGPTSPWPRAVSAVVSLVLAYLMAAGVCLVLDVLRPRAAEAVHA